MFSKSRSGKKWTTFVASVMLITCLVVEIIKRWIMKCWIVSFADSLYPCVPTAQSYYGMHKSTVMPGLNAIAQILSDILLLEYNKVQNIVKFEKQKIEKTEKRLDRPIVGLYLHSKLDGHCLNSLWNNRTFIILMIKIMIS